MQSSSIFNQTTGTSSITDKKYARFNTDQDKILQHYFTALHEKNVILNKHQLDELVKELNCVSASSGPLKKATRQNVTKKMDNMKVAAKKGRSAAASELSAFAALPPDEAPAQGHAKTVPQAHEEGLEYGDNAADIAADNMAATFAAKTAYEEMQREVVPPEGADRGSTLQPASGWAGSVEKHLERTHWSTPSELSAQDLAVLGRGFECPAPEGDEESLSVPPSEASVNLGHHACERLSNRSES